MGALAVAGAAWIALVLSPPSAHAAGPAERVVFATPAPFDDPGGLPFPRADGFAGSPEVDFVSSAVRFAWKGSAVWFFASVADTTPLTLATMHDDPAILRDDGLSLLLVTPGTSDPPILVTVSAAGVILDARGAMAEDRSPEFVLAQVTPRTMGYDMTVRVDLGIAGLATSEGTVLALELVQTDRTGPDAVSPTPWIGNAADAQTWGRLVLVGSGAVDGACLGGFDRQGVQCVDQGNGCAIGAHGAAHGRPLGAVPTMLGLAWVTLVVRARRRDRCRSAGSRRS